MAEGKSYALLYSTWPAYELIDSGDGEKLERFGEYVLIRPEPQAIWKPVLSKSAWDERSHAKFSREQKDHFRFTDEVKGGWQKHKDMPDNWTVTYAHDKLQIKLKLALTAFGHVGVFPEQGDNWNYIYKSIQHANAPFKVLNLFAYTGAASIAARQAGADVVHCDASRPGINWANQNMQLNGLTDIRWVYEDAFKFVRREAKRENKYNGIIMDPPPYGRGPDGEKWVLEDQLDELVRMASTLLIGSPGFFILNMYAIGLSPIVGHNVVSTYIHSGEAEYGELYLPSSEGKDLPMGTFVRVKI